LVIRDTTGLTREASSPRNHSPILRTFERAAPRFGPGSAEEGERVPNNNVQRFRESLMMSKAELARKAGLSTLTIDRVEAGRPCRLDTKRKILLALGLRVSDKDRVFAAVAEELAAFHPPVSSDDREFP
jgi:DNA-binding XRE family transcriptional regulator